MPSPDVMQLERIDPEPLTSCGLGLSSWTIAVAMIVKR